MKSLFCTLLLIVLVFVTHVSCYLAEKSSPFTVHISLQQQQDEPIKLKAGDTIEIKWNMVPGVRFPLYGYASSRTAKTDGKSPIHVQLLISIYIVGLLTTHDVSRTQPYVYTISTDLSILDNSYIWTVGHDIPSGEYQIGIGFFYHEVAYQKFVVL
ncbi:uncharacterized protein B0P05DRAFT_534303 [Gilbertella persicaria]|uniref:uncharacterized protein n=1 Tax=Gilbertella persicaria TaxID=101096 RepID=UPI0022207519|nr:uncharacterized protein B0P05DRAFT_534303 [Gilbertella persicaria]KAI8085934.1 hypothetical protein B0P05DRAFT_534303 [Gilbertella persicaria]